MAVRETALDLEELIVWCESLTGKSATDEFDSVGRKGGEISQSAMLDFAVLSEALAEEGVGVELTVVLALDYVNVNRL
jgi:hypothetical protein